MPRFRVLILACGLGLIASLAASGQTREWNANAEAQMAQGAWDEARRTYLKLHARLAKTLGPEHPQTVLALANACDASVQLAARLDSLPLCTRALALKEKVMGRDSPETAKTLSDLALLYSAEGELARAEKLLERALRIAGADPHSPDAAGLMNNLGYLYYRRGKYTRARAVLERAVFTLEQRADADKSDLVTMLGNLGTAELAAHDAPAAQRHFRQALSLAEESGAEAACVMRRHMDVLHCQPGEQLK